MSNNESDLVTLPASELRELIRDALREALGEPTILKAEALASLLGCAPADVVKLHERGMPISFEGEYVRVEFPKVLTWLTKGALAR